MKLRTKATKRGKVRFTSHRDLARMWERAIRRIGLPVAVSEGFTPRAKLSFGLALPTGAESIAEYIDIELGRALTDDELVALPSALSDALPEGIDVVAVAERRAGSASLQEAVTSCTWELWHPGLSGDVIVAARGLLDASSLVLERERKGRRSADDVRPAILDLRAQHDDRGDRLIADLATAGRGLRPSELARLAFPDFDPVDVRVLRTHQWIDCEGERCDVLDEPRRHRAGASAAEVLV